MITVLLATLKIFGWLGLVLGLCASVNIIGKTYINLGQGEKFSWAKMAKGISKVVVAWGLGLIFAMACALLPYINTIAMEYYGITLVAEEVLDTLSIVAMLGIIVSSITAQGKKALETIATLYENIN